MTKENIELFNAICIIILPIIGIIWIMTIWSLIILYKVKRSLSRTNETLVSKTFEILSQFYSQINYANGTASKNYFLKAILSKLEDIKSNNPTVDALEIHQLSNKINSLSAKLDTINLLEEEVKIAKIELDKAQKKLETAENNFSELKRTADNDLQIVRNEAEVKLQMKQSECEQKIEKLNTDNEEKFKSINSVIEKNKELHIPDFIKTGLCEDIQSLYQDVLLSNQGAKAVWTSLGSFKSSLDISDSSDFSLQILKQLGIDLVKYFTLSQNSDPSSTREKLSRWAECFNNHSNNKFSLFVPALLAPVNNTIMQSSSSDNTVNEVLCWGIRNPNGIIYSTAQVR